MTDPPSPARSPAAAALAAYARAAEGAFAEATARALRADLRVFAAWAHAAGHAPDLPVPPGTAAAFVDALGAVRKPATVARYLASLNHLHRAAGLDPPGVAAPVRLALRRLRRSRGTRQDQAAPLGWAGIARILATLDDSPAGLRDAALLCLAYDSFARRAELAALDRADLEAACDGTGRVLIRRAKTDPDGQGSWRFVAADSMDRLARWCAAAGIAEGALFRPLGNAARRDRLAAGDIARIIARRARAAGLPRAVSAHSTRIGAAQDALAHNLDTAAIQQAGGWTSPRMVARYGERLAPARSAAARLAAIQGR